ncbi:CFEM domain-containing protein [Fusarium keratoplasticum]|nr:CFEM domain-containing protein [Fusarium keratoplasticum]
MREQKCLPIDALVTANATSTACHATIRDRRQNFDILTITLLVVTSIVVALRFFERIQPSFSLHADDYIILFCLSLYIGQALYATEVFAIKLPVLLFYLRIFPGVSIRRLIWGTFVFTLVSLVVFLVLALAQCQPVSYYWQGWDATHEGHCLGINALAWAIAAVSIVLDLWMLGLPLSQLIQLQMHWRRKLAVASMFGVGTFVTVVSIIRLRFLVAFGNSINPTWDAYSTCYWSIIELNVAICCTCMPNLRLLWLRTFPRISESSSNQLTDIPSASLNLACRNSNAPASHSTGELYGAAVLNDYGSTPSVDRTSTTELVGLGGSITWQRKGVA